MFLLTKQLLTLVILANGLAWPVAFYLMNRWLEGFAYRIRLDLTTFAGAGLVTLVVAVLTVVLQAYRASTANPVKGAEV
jgi:putative ABC transport system permease protein